MSIPWRQEKTFFARCIISSLAGLIIELLPSSDAAGGEDVPEDIIDGGEDDELDENREGEVDTAAENDKSDGENASG